MSDRAKLLGTGQKIDVLTSVAAPTFADRVDPERNRKTFVVPPGEPEAQRLNAIQSARNPLLAAAGPLLRAQADMPNELDQQGSALLRQILEQEMRAFQRLCEQANIRKEHMVGARYCLCTALDEAAMQTQWGKDASAEWIKNGMATTFRQDRDGGKRVFLLIARLLEDPKEHHDLLQVIYRILSLGFEGRYRHALDGERTVRAIRERLYNEIIAQREPVPTSLSVTHRADASGTRLSFFEFPVWITVTALSLTLLAMFAWFKYQLVSRSTEVQKQIAEIGRLTPPPTALAPAVPEHLLKTENAIGIVGFKDKGSAQGLAQNRRVENIGAQ
jgi:type VI secretion system protein ImpK